MPFPLSPLQSLNIHATKLNKVQPEGADCHDTLTLRKPIRIINLSLNFIRKFERFTCVRSFVRPSVSSFVCSAWCLVGSGAAFSFRPRVSRRVLFLEESKSAVGRSVPLPGLRAVDYAPDFTCTRNSTLGYRLEPLPTGRFLSRVLP